MKKITLGVFVFSVIALLGISLAAAFPMGFSKGPMAKELTEEEQTEMQAFHDSMQNAIETQDFESWKTLMESQITEENFQKMIESHKQMEEMRIAFEEARESGDFSEVKAINEEYGFKGEGDFHMMRGGTQFKIMEKDSE